MQGVKWLILTNKTLIGQQFQYLCAYKREWFNAIFNLAPQVKLTERKCVSLLYILYLVTMYIVLQLSLFTSRRLWGIPVMLSCKEEKKHNFRDNLLNWSWLSLTKTSHLRTYLWDKQSYAFVGLQFWVVLSWWASALHLSTTDQEFVDKETI